MTNALDTDFPSLEDSIKAKTSELEITNKELEAFSYSVSHDLRAPLRRVKGYCRAVLEDNKDQLDPTSIDYLQRACATISHMNTLITDLLNFSRTQRQSLQRNLIDLTALANNITHNLNAQSERKNTTFIIQPAIIAEGDESLIGIVLENLMSNAWKFSRKVPMPCIEFGAIAQKNNTVYFVKDNGAGFDMHYAYKLFSPFQRLHHEDEFEGTGIGLATVKRIIHRHGGRIWAESTTNKGAIFYFTLS